MTESIEELVLVPKSELDFLRNCLKNGSNTTPKESAMCENYNSNQENFKAEEGFEKNKAQKKEKKTQKKEKEILDNDLLDQCIKDSGILFDDCKMSEAYDDDNVDDEKMMTQDYNSQNEMKNQVQNVADENITSSPILETSNKNEKPCTVSTIDLGEVLEKTFSKICSRYKKSFSIFKDFILSRPKIYKRLQRFENLEQMLTTAFSKKQTRMFKNEKRFYEVLQRYGDNLIYIIPNEKRIQTMIGGNFRPWYKI